MAARIATWTTRPDPHRPDLRAAARAVLAGDGRGFVLQPWQVGLTSIDASEGGEAVVPPGCGVGKGWLDARIREAARGAARASGADLDPLDRHRHGPAAAEAQRREPVAALAPRQLVEQRRDDPRAAGPDRVPERDRAAVDVDAVPVEPELAAVGQRLRGERLVDLDQVVLVGRDPRPRAPARGRPRSGRGTASAARPRPARSRRPGPAA